MPGNSEPEEFKVFLSASLTASLTWQLDTQTASFKAGFIPLGLLYDDQEASQSFTLVRTVCQLRGVLGNNFPRTVPRYTTVIPAGRSGWMWFVAVGDEAITGVLLSRLKMGWGAATTCTT